MGDPVTLGLAVAQVVVPIALVAMPAVWIKIVEVLRRIPRISKDHPGHNTNLACIHSILDSLEHMRDLAWIQQSNNPSLLNNLKLRADSLENMINNDKRILQFLHKGKIAKTIRSIALMMQLLETNARVRQASTSTKSTDRLDLAFYQRSRENLCKDLLDILDKDDLEPVIIRTWQEASIGTSGTYKRIVYEFKCEPEHGYPRTLCVSRGVRECLEALLKWLRDLKLLQDTINTGCSSLLGVALYELFSEVLPKVLVQHLQRSKLNATTAKQFYLNVRFLRSISVSPTFKAIQGEHGLHLEDEDKITVDLRKDGWVTWNDVEREASNSTFRLENHRSSSKLEVAGPSSRGGASSTRSGNMDPLECTLCGLVIQGNSRHEDTLRFEQHWEACFRQEQGLNDYNAMIHERCPVCKISIDDWSFDLRQLHTNACLDGHVGNTPGT